MAKEIISISLSPKTIENINRVLEIRDFGYENRSILIEKAIVEFLKREVVKYGKIYSG